MGLKIDWGLLIFFPKSTDYTELYHYCHLSGRADRLALSIKHSHVHLCLKTRNTNHNYVIYALIWLYYDEHHQYAIYKNSKWENALVKFHCSTVNVNIFNILCKKICWSINKNPGNVKFTRGTPPKAWILPTGMWCFGLVLSKKLGGFYCENLATLIYL